MENFIRRIIKYTIALNCCVIGLYCKAQLVVGDSIKQQFITYQLNNYNEKIFVHTDKTFYITGESIWFKIYCVDENFHKPSSVSRIAYVEIINKENKAVLQAKIVIDSGMGNGSFIIPSYISSDNYKLRAYTKWMENFDPDYFFEQPLTIINNLKPVTGQPVVKQKKYSINFFPEGGNLVESITSQIAFKAVDAYGNPADCSGKILDENNNAITIFQTLKLGTGSFYFTPKEGSYKAIINLNDTVIEQTLPTVYKQGYVIHLENADNNQLKLTVSAKTGSDDIIYLLAHSQNVFKDFQQQKLSNNQTVFFIDKSKLAGGISNITIFNKDRQPVCERLYFKRPAAKLNIQMQTDKTVYHLREPVNVSVKANTGTGPAQTVGMSVSVFMIDSLQSSNYTDIFSYLLLSSELKGNINSPAYHFQNNNDADKAADDLMLTQDWRRFKWNEVLQNKKPFYQFLPEHEGFIINGKITGRYNNVPAKNISTTLTVPGENFQLATAASNASGNLLYNVKNFYGSSSLIIQCDSNYKPEITSPFSNNFSAAVLPQFEMPWQWKNELLFRSINTQADNAFLISKKQQSYLYNAEDTSLFYGRPDKRYNLDDYTRFITMEEVMREYVDAVRVRKEGQQFHFKMLNFLNKSYFDDDPLILVDGLPVNDASQVIAIDPLKIKRLDVITDRYYYGDMISDGIVSYISYKGDLAGLTLNASDIIINYDGLQREREFYSPVYDNSGKTSNHMPDVRNVLYWSPKIKTGADGKANFGFYTSDIPGKYACVIQGITSKGTAGSSIIFFDVAK